MNYGWIYFCGGGGQNKEISSCSTLHLSQIFMLTMFDNVLRVDKIGKIDKISPKMFTFDGHDTAFSC
jgi:hypothetical protein